MTTATAEKKPTAYKWVALSNTTLGILMATINSSIVIISLPAIFRGVKLNPLGAGNVSYLLWMLMGYLLVSAVLVVSLGRLGDIYGRVRIYNAGFLVFSLALGLPRARPAHQRCRCAVADRRPGDPGHRRRHAHGQLQRDRHRRVPRPTSAASPSASTWSPACPVRSSASSPAACSPRSTGAWCSGSASRSACSARSGPTAASRRSAPRTRPASTGGATSRFAIGLSALLSGITYGIQPYGGHNMGWTNPWVEAGLIGGVVMLGVFCFVETKVAAPMFHLELFKVRAFAAGNSVTFLSSIARGGLQFMLIIWLQGIWLPLHGYSYENTPLWAGIYLVPLTIGFLIAGPLSGFLSDKFGARAFASGGLLLVALTFGGLLLLPTDFSYGWFALLIGLNGFGSGLFAAPNTAAVMNSVPAAQRGAANGMMSTFQNSGMVLSIGIFFSLMVVGLAEQAAEHDVRRPHRQRRARDRRPPDRQPAAGRRPVRVVPRLQPARHAAHPGPRDRADRRPARDPDRQGVLPAPDRAAVPPRPRDRVHPGDRDVAGRAPASRCCAASTSCTTTPRPRTPEPALEAEGDLLLESADSAQS